MAIIVDDAVIERHPQTQRVTKRPSRTFNRCGKLLEFVRIRSKEGEPHTFIKMR